MTSQKTAGVLLAATAAALFGSVNIATAAEPSTGADQVKCAGVNACKGMSECASATNACKAKNSCKGQGWMHMTKEECATKDGTVMEEKK